MSGPLVVTGGCGYVGSRLTAQLVKQGSEVVIIDNLSKGTPENLPAEVVNNVHLVAADIRDADTLTRYFKYYKPTKVLHLAAMHFILDCERDPLKCISVNVDGTQAVLDACSAASTVDGVVLASSAAVYRPSSEAHHEGSEVGPTDIYGLSKLWVEQLGQLFHRKTGIKTGIARIFNVFGPGETNPHLIPSIVQQLQYGDVLQLGNLTTQRDYVYVDDVSQALTKLSEMPEQHGLLTCNIGREQQVDGRTLVGLFEEITGRKLIVQKNAERVRVSDRPYLLSDCQRAHELLGWTATVGLKEGLREALQQPYGALVSGA